MLGKSADANPVGFADADLELQETLDNLDSADNYAGWIFALIEPYLGELVLEVGAGHGTVTEIVARTERRVVASDISETCTRSLNERFGDAQNVVVIHGDIAATAAYGPFDTAILLNVLEHIEDDDAALRELSKVLKDKGSLVVWVPAFPALYSDFDRKVGHFRRYTVKGLRAQLQRDGFEVQEIRYVNWVGAMAWWIVARMLHRTPTRRTSIKLFDRYLVPVVKWIESKVRPPFGQSVLAVASVPAGQRPPGPQSGSAPLSTNV